MTGRLSCRISPINTRNDDDFWIGCASIRYASCFIIVEKQFISAVDECLLEAEADLAGAETQSGAIP